MEGINMTSKTDIPENVRQMTKWNYFLALPSPRSQKYGAFFRKKAAGKWDVSLHLPNYPNPANFVVKSRDAYGMLMEDIAQKWVIYTENDAKTKHEIIRKKWG